ncbi:hypothetical protein IU402_00890 [Aerococcaceae bacterium zg-BR9]|uniref:hypothetical protein n=1 Tax=Aerococcaceae bacterium zg-1292 TaxID=2774330 RepID=UPI004063B65D|nr:hypothetical protein [Aerococcaceae bacterium zg-BR9]
MNENSDFLEAYQKANYPLAFRLRKERIEFIKKITEERNNKEETPFLQRMIMEFDHLSKKGLYYNAPESSTRAVNFITHSVLNAIIPILFISYVVLLSSDFILLDRLMVWIPN